MRREMNALGRRVGGRRVVLRRVLIRRVLIRCVVIPGVVGALVVATFSGCRGRGFLPPPGPMNQQQANAVIHDPFPQADIAPSDPSARPLGYQQPLPEPVRNRIVPDAMPWLGR